MFGILGTPGSHYPSRNMMCKIMEDLTLKAVEAA